MTSGTPSAAIGWRAGEHQPVVDRRPVGGQRLAELAHPGVVEVEVHAARQRVPGLVALDVDRERGVGAALLVDARPLRRGDHAARLHLRVLEGDARLLGALGEVGERHAAALLERAEAGDREAAVGHAGEREDRLGDLLGALERRPAVGRAAARRAPLRGRELLDLAVGLPRRALDGRAELLGQRAERRPLLGDRAVVALDDGQARASCGPGTGSHSPARQSRTSPRGWAISPGVSCSTGVGDDVAAHAEVLGRRAARTRARSRRTRPSPCAPPTAAAPPG